MGQIVRTIAITSGAQTTVKASTWCRGYIVQEDESGPPGGLKITWPNGTVAEYGTAQQPIKVGRFDGTGELIGTPAGALVPSNTATTYFQVESIGATSVLQITEVN